MKISEYNGSDKTRRYTGLWFTYAILAFTTSLPTISLAQAIGFQMVAIDGHHRREYRSRFTQ
jgi:hypothetical protein